MFPGCAARPWSDGFVPETLTGDELGRIVRILQQLAEGPEIAAEYAQVIQAQLDSSPPRSIPTEERANLNAWLT